MRSREPRLALLRDGFFSGIISTFLLLMILSAAAAVR